MDRDILDATVLVAEAIEAAGGRYFVGGSFASSVDGEPRATSDVDFVVDLPRGAIDRFVDLLGPSFEVDREMLRDALATGRSANGFYLPIVLKIDFFGHAYGAFDVSEFDRRRKVEIRPGVSLFVKTPEDTILRKLEWYRLGGESSERQWRDVLGVLRGRASIDAVYLDRWAPVLGVVDLLDRARRAAQLDRA